MEATALSGPIQIQFLIDEGLYRSGELLSTLLLSVAAESVSMQLLESLGDVLAKKEEHRRAIAYYQRVQSLQVQQKVSAADDARVKFKIAQSRYKLREYKPALTLLESIPSEVRTLGTRVLIGKLYQSLGNTALAVMQYKEAIKMCPYALEALLECIQLGCNASEILSLYSSTPAWFQSILKGLLCLAQKDPKRALSFFTNIPEMAGNICIYLPVSSSGKQIYTGTVSLSLSLSLLSRSLLYQISGYYDFRLMAGVVQQQVAVSYAQAGNHEKAMAAFERIRQQDPLCLDYMDVYAGILTKRSLFNLNSLAKDLIYANPLRPEPWTATALYLDAKGNKDKAISFTEKAVLLNDRHAHTFVVRGNLLLSGGYAEQAGSCFRKAHMLSRSLESHQGLAESLLMLGKYNDALMIAQEAHAAAPNNTKSITLYAKVLSQRPEHRDKAKKLLEEAMKVNPLSVDLLFSYIEVLDMEGKTQIAVQKLKEHLAHTGHEEGWNRLGELLTKLKCWEEAMAAFHSALNFNVSSERARRGIDRVEKLMRGEDPDAPEADPDAEGQGDEEESAEGAEF